MSKDNNGGPAFPAETNNRYYVGMSLRDYFAAKAMQGLLADPTTPEITDIAGAAYEVADAMLKARNGEL